MILEELTLEILAERVLTKFDSKKLVDWAVKVLEIGYESDNLYILAGLDFEMTEDREEYFWKCVKDLKIEVKKSEYELIEKYALTIASRAIQKEISVDYAFSQMLKIVSASEYDNKYIVFSEIDEDLNYLTYNDSVIFNSGLTLENSKDFIMEEMKIFVQMENLKIPLADRSKCYCETCKKLNTPITKSKYHLKRPFISLVWSCGLCGSEKIKYNNSHDVKKMIIEKFKKNYA